MRLSSLPLLSLATVASAASKKWEATNFCKCICFQTNSTILHLDLPDNPAQPCLSCTKKWCLNQNLPICAGASLGDTNPDTATGKEGDVEARCFQRDSPRDQLVVTLFLLTVFGLLLVAGIKNRIAKVGLTSELPWQNGRRWLEETFVPGRQRERFRLGQIHRDSDYERLERERESRSDNDSPLRP
ncbi:hypothetical protein AGABI1DRAFT_51399 [Agaricus bisporus var. burnettii JB137-S8]|uniref:Uncharacterized protein n=1 Tax=Agaricus bisporus var. burnettii (strain JB137-S8 / ATCC MYA-4627 / FGSC 10392) TaxID=597362 RepID=K5XK11_AGABU|nr:uncharacterized protein AGABI1DRAFT_51399 [Agaricus bisporus var. burnettii JB137-S8]EKM83868.1 hypothetical protein AGABI1DRAFT_51399 [Agaricus bisporus var. burnettii JB137-S8]